MKKKLIFYSILFILSIIVISISLMIGTVKISPGDFISSIFGDDNIIRKIIFDFRLPRVLVAFTVGASLAVSGVVFQAILKNPLSDPFTLGISSGAGLGAAIPIILTLSTVYISLGALIGSIGVSLFIYFVSKRRHFGSTSLILAGVSIGFIASAAIMLLFALSSASSVQKVFLWMTGDLSIARYSLLWNLLPLSFVIIGILFLYHRHMDIIAFGNEFAKTAGVTEKNIITLFWLGSILAGISVSLVGIIGFIGLVVPHMIRSFVGIKHSKVIILSTFTGGIFLVLCDLLGRVLISPLEIPVGVITSFIGGTFFLLMMVRKGDRL